MQVQHRQVLALAVLHPLAVAQVINLYGRAAEAFHTMYAAAQDQQVGGLW